MKPFSKLTLTTLMVAALLTGCAQHQSITDGDKYLQAGQYELAVEQYNRATQLDPDDQKLKAKAQQARKQYHAALKRLQQEARAMEQAGRYSVALLLYGKVVSVDPHSSSNLRYQALRQKLVEQYIFRLKLAQDPQVFGRYFLQKQSNVKLVPTFRTSNRNIN
jgi:tetratricopeptide (TPR) repeat protein